MTLTQTETTAQENRTPSLSIVTVVWNDPVGLGNTFRSLFPVFEEPIAGRIRFEHVIVDSSPEQHQDAYAALPPGYPLRRMSTPKKGVYPAMNLGAEAATGELIWFLNAGDTLCDAAALSLSLPLFPLGTRAILCGPVVVRSSGGELMLDCPNFSHGTYGKNRICHQAVLYPRALLAEFAGFDSRYLIAADFHLHLKMYLAGVDLIQYPQAFARFELGGISSRVIPALQEFSRAQWELNRGLADALTRQMVLLKDSGCIGFSRLAQKIVGQDAHHRLKKFVRDFR